MTGKPKLSTRRHLPGTERFPTREQLMCYANRYPDVKHRFGMNSRLLWGHWVHTGEGQGRIATCGNATTSARAEEQ